METGTWTNGAKRIASKTAANKANTVLVINIGNQTLFAVLLVYGVKTRPFQNGVITPVQLDIVLKFFALVKTTISLCIIYFNLNQNVNIHRTFNNYINRF